MIAQILQGVPSDAPAELAIVGMSILCVIFAVYYFGGLGGDKHISSN